MIKLNASQLKGKMDYISDYIKSENAADGSKMDANANVSSKNLATLEAEINKDINVQINRTLVSNKIKSLFGEDLSKEYIRQIEDHEIYVHDETSLKPYCASINLYPFLIDGLKGIGGESKAPKHLDSFCGSFINLTFAVSSQFAGAIATVEFLMYFDYFANKDLGKDYLDNYNKVIDSHFQHVVYSINQPAAARGYQSVFWNISIYDESYFESLFGDFYFPDGTKPEYDSIKRLQQYFMKWFNKERLNAVLTFPVVTAAMLIANDVPKDTEFSEMCAEELSEGNSFFIYQSTSADSLASCCRLRNEISDNTFSYSLGAGGVSTGSVNVITINMNRLVQDGRDIKTEVEKIHKYQVAYRQMMDEYEEAGMLPVYTAKMITLNKQFLTIGINGMAEAAESKGLKVGNNEGYKTFVKNYLKVIYDANKEAKKLYGYMFNTEFVPAENLGVKNSKWDKKDGYKVERECYNSYFYLVEDEEINIIDKFLLHGKEMIEFLDGGSALHMNLGEYATKEGFTKLINIAAKTGCNYFCFNIKVTICNTCHNIDKHTRTECPKCQSKDIDHATRVIGYLKRVKNFSSNRQKEHALRNYHKSK